MRLFNYRAGSIFLLGLVVSGAVQAVTHAQEKQPLTAKITIDEDILAAFADEPCHHFEEARDRFVAGDLSQSSEHLRTAAAYLRLEAARAKGNDKTALDESIQELQRIALAVETNQLRSVRSLSQVFARAHFALACHHCVKCSDCCCREGESVHEPDTSTSGHDLKAAANHLTSGMLWAGSTLDRETRNTLEASQRAADDLIRMKETRRSDVRRAIHAVHSKLEKLTQRKVTLAPSFVEPRGGAPSIFR